MRKNAESQEIPVQWAIDPQPMKSPIFLTTLLLGHTDGPASPASRLGVLTTDTQAPVVAETPVGPDFLQALEIITELRVDTVGQELRVLAVDDIALPVEEPGGDLVLSGVLEDVDDALELLRGELTSTVSMRSMCQQAISKSLILPSTPEHKGVHTACSGRHRPS